VVVKVVALGLLKVVAILILPAPLVIVTLLPAVNVALVNPVPFPISNAPFAGVVVNPVPPLATGKVPVTPVVSGNPVALVSTPDVGVPSKGVTSVGLVERTVLPDPVEVVTPVPPLATGKAVPDKLNANVPLVVTGEPATDKNAGTVAATDVTVPPELLEAIVIAPEEFVIVTLLPAVNVVRVNPVPLPMSNAPFAGVVVKPVPPLATGRMPVMFEAAVEAIFTKSEPFHAAKHFSAATIVMPVVGPAPRSTIEPVPALITM
jgi:hypothetical protein